MPAGKTEWLLHATQQSTDRSLLRNMVRIRSLTWTLTRSSLPQASRPITISSASTFRRSCSSRLSAPELSYLLRLQRNKWGVCLLRLCIAVPLWSTTLSKVSSTPLVWTGYTVWTISLLSARNQGSCAVLDNSIQMDMTLDDGIVAIKKCIIDLCTRFIIKQPLLMAKIVTREDIKIFQPRMRDTAAS